MVETSDTKPTGVKGFVLAVRRKLYDHVAGSIAVAIVAVATTALVLAWNPLKLRMEDSVTGLKNISFDEALREARSIVGSRTIFATPFRNRNDASQYIAVWYEIDQQKNPCDTETASTPDWCALQLGPIGIDILVGGQGAYERQATHITAGTHALGMGPEDLATLTQAAGKPIQRYWGVVDHDGDGTKEILGIADSAGTAPTLPVYVSLYETATGKVRQLRSYPSRFSVKNEFQGVQTSAVRAWLIARLNEFQKPSGDLCDRDLAGRLSCTESPAFKQNRAQEEKLYGHYTANETWIMKSVEDWVADNGVDFTQGRIKLAWSKGRFTDDGDCIGLTGRYEWINDFKGPLVANDRMTGQRAVVYLQDGDHHREIPSVVFGKRYVWLALAADKAILAIDPKTFELRRFEVPEFAAGVPASWSEAGKPPEMVSQQELDATKDYQLDGLRLDGGRLVYGDMALSPPVPADEFTGARQCPAM